MLKKKVLIFISLFTCILSFGIGLNAKADTKWTGTAVPNIGYVENVYFNTNLSIDEVVSLLDTITFNINEGTGEIDYDVLLNSTQTVFISLSKSDGVYAILDMAKFANNDYDGAVLFASFDIMGFGWVGWNPNFNGEYIINDTLNTPSNDVEQNDKLSLLFSTTPFEKVEVEEEKHFTQADIDAAFNSGYLAGLKETNVNAELKSILGPLYNGTYLGFINGDTTINSSVGNFNTEYVEFLNGNEIDLSYFVDIISADIQQSTRYDIVLMFDKSIKLSDIDLSIRGVNNISYLYGDSTIYDISIVDYRSLTNHIYDINKNINAIQLTILDYEEFIKCNGVLIFNGLNELYLNGYNNGYVNGYNGGLNDTINNNKIYNDGYNDGYDVAIEESEIKIEESYNNGYDYGYSSGLTENIEENVNLDEYYKDYFNSGYHDGYLIGKDEGEKAVISFKNILTYMWQLPVDLLKSLLDYEIWGMNFYSLFKFILSVGLILGVLNLLRFNFSINVSNSSSRSNSRINSVSTSTSHNNINNRTTSTSHNRINNHTNSTSHNTIYNQKGDSKSAPLKELDGVEIL